MTAILIPLSIMTGIFRGIKEGMIMSLDGDITHNNAASGIRGHHWFNWYKRISIAKLLSFGLLCITWYSLGYDLLTAIACLFTIWTFYELSYSYTRYNVLIPRQEFIDFIDLYSWYVWCNNVKYITIARVITTVVLWLVKLCLIYHD